MEWVSKDQASSDDLEQFIRQLSNKGITLWAEESTLRFRAPKGALTAEERRILHSANAAISSLLERRSCRPAVENAFTRCAGARRAPLSFTQVAHWHDRQEHGGRPVRHIASAIRLTGRLRVEVLEEALEAIGCRHDALRTRIVLRDGKSPVQEVADEYRPELEVVQLSSTPESQRAAELERRIQRAILEAYDYATSPLFKAVLLAIDEGEHVLILALDHMISDLASLNILFEEVRIGYSELLEGTAPRLPQIPVQFPDYAARQRAGFVERKGSPGTRFASVTRTRFPDDPNVGTRQARTGWGMARFLIGRALRDELRDWARRRGPTIVIAPLTAYAALVMRWCRVAETVIPFEIDGRMGSALERTIGFLAFPIYIRAALSERSTFSDLLRQITGEFCTACDEADFGCAGARVPRPEFARNAGFNWLPAQAQTGSLVPESGLDLTWSAVEFDNPLLQSLHLDTEPAVSFADQDEGIVGQVYYARSRFCERTMEKFASEVVTFLMTLVRTPDRVVSDVNPA